MTNDFAVERERLGRDVKRREGGKRKGGGQNKIRKEFLRGFTGREFSLLCPPPSYFAGKKLGSRQ